MNKIQGFIKTINSEFQQFKSFSDDRFIEGYFTTTDVDRGGEVSLPSAFVRTMETYMKNPVVTYMHDVRQVIGKILTHKIDEKGVWVRAQIAKNVKWADEVWSLIEQGMIKGFSYGYKIIDFESGEKDGNPVTFLKDVELFEVSIVTVPMNSSALFSISEEGGIKSVTVHLENLDEKGMTHNSTLADSEPSWGGIDKTELPRGAFADKGETGKKSTWKFPHHWISGDNMYLHKGGLHAAWAAAHGARSGQTASGEVTSHLNVHRKAIGEDEKDIYEILEVLEELKEILSAARTQEIEIDAKELASSIVTLLKEQGLFQVKEPEKNPEKQEEKDAVDKTVMPTIDELKQMLTSTIESLK